MGDVRRDVSHERERADPVRQEPEPERRRSTASPEVHPPPSEGHALPHQVPSRADDLDDDAADDPALLEGNDSEQDVESKALLVELQKLVAQAGDSRAPKLHAGAWCARRTRDGEPFASVKHLGVNSSQTDSNDGQQIAGGLGMASRVGTNRQLPKTRSDRAQTAVYSRMLSVFLALLFAASCAGAQSAWQFTKQDDALHGRVLDQFVLTGKYLTPPRNAATGEAPSIVVVCSDRKVQQNYLAVGAVVNQDPRALFIHMEARLDGKSRDIAADSVSTDGTSVFFTRADLAKVLRSHTLIIGANEYLGPQIVMQFNIPDSSQIFDACSSDRILKRAAR